VQWIVKRQVLVGIAIGLAAAIVAGIAIGLLLSMGPDAGPATTTVSVAHAGALFVVR